MSSMTAPEMPEAAAAVAARNKDGEKGVTKGLIALTVTSCQDVGGTAWPTHPGEVRRGGEERKTGRKGWLSFAFSGVTSPPNDWLPTPGEYVPRNGAV